KGPSHERQSGLDIPLDQLRGQTEDAISEASERGVSARVSRRTPSVVLAIDLDHESRLRRDEVGDVAAEHDLPAKRYAEARAAQVVPEQRLRTGGRGAHAVSPLRQERGALGGLTSCVA